MALDDRGLACPREPSDHFPESADFSTDTFHNRIAHTGSIYDGAMRAREWKRLSPLSTERLVDVANSCCAAQEFLSLAKTAMLTPSRAGGLARLMRQ